MITKKLLRDYQVFLDNQSLIKRSEIKNFFNKYLEFKKNVHMLIYEKNKTRMNLPYFVRKYRNILSSNKKNKISYENFQIKTNKFDRPYFLLLLTKSNHWYTKYANPDLVHRVTVIKNVWRNIPLGYDLVLKKHPLMKFDDEIDYVVSELPHCYVSDNFSTFELIENAEIILFSGTTIGIESLIQKKNVIEIGQNSMGFNMKNPPLKRVPNFNVLSDKISEALEEIPSTEKIYAYFNSLLNNSFSFQHDSKSITFERNLETCEKIANIVAQKIESDFE